MNNYLKYKFALYDLKMLLIYFLIKRLIYVLLQLYILVLKRVLVSAQIVILSLIKFYFNYNNIKVPSLKKTLHENIKNVDFANEVVKVKYVVKYK